MSVFCNVIKPQGLEPFQFSTKISSPSEETGYPPRYYVAREGVDFGCLEKTDKVTYCPFKGLATYYVIRGRQGEIRDAAWSYDRPYREAELLRDRLAFDATKVLEAVDTDV